MPAKEPEPESDGMGLLDRLVADPGWWPDPPSRAEWEEGRRILRRLPWWQRTRLLALGTTARWLHAALVWAEARAARRAARAAVDPRRTHVKTQGR